MVCFLKCSWCGKVLKVEKDRFFGQFKVSHGMCKFCAERWEQEWEDELKEREARNQGRQ